MGLRSHSLYNALWIACYAGKGGMSAASMQSSCTFSKRNANASAILSTCSCSDETTQRSPCRSTNALQGNPIRRKSVGAGASSSAESRVGSVATGVSEVSDDACNQSNDSIAMSSMSMLHEFTAVVS